MSAALPRRRVLGCVLALADYDAAVAGIGEAIRGGRRGYVCVANVHSVTTGVLSPAHRARMNGSLLTVPDGMPLVWALRGLHRARLQDRVYGPELAKRLLAEAEREGWRVYLYGSDPRTLRALEAAARAGFPRLALAGTRSPPFRPLSPAEDAGEVRAISETGPDLVLVGLGAPKQERWMADHAGRVPGVLVGVGASFDFLAGTKPQAPAGMRRRGLEWIFRLATEPARLWRRYLLTNPLFLLLVGLRALGVRAPWDRP